MDTKLIAIPFSAISLNDAYPTNRGGRRFTLPDVVDFKESVVACLSKQLPVEKIKVPLICHYWFLYPKISLYTLAGTPTKKDVSNLFKIVEDAIASYIGIDDSYVFHISGTKLEMPEDFETYCINPTRWGVGKYKGFVFLQIRSSVLPFDIWSMGDHTPQISRLSCLDVLKHLNIKQYDMPWTKLFLSYLDMATKVLVDTEHLVSDTVYDTKVAKIHWTYKKKLKNVKVLEDIQDSSAGIALRYLSRMIEPKKMDIILQELLQGPHLQVLVKWIEELRISLS